MRALYQDLATSNLQRAPKANTGLWYDKYCDWPVKNGQVDWDLSTYKEERREINPKQDWIGTVTGQKAGDGKAIAAACQRLNQLAEKTWGIEKPQIFKTQWRFVSGLGREHPVENGLAWHHTLGVPYLPGSSVKGMVRAWAEHWLNEDKDDIARILGPRETGEVGSIIFFDALPTGEVQLEMDIMTPHYGPYYSEGEAPGDWHDPVPIPFLTVAANQTFQFLIAPRHLDCEQSRQDAETARGWLRDALEWIGAGAKTAVGYGRMKKPSDQETSQCWATGKAVLQRCEWVEKKIQEITEKNHARPDETLGGKSLADAWDAIEDMELKQRALADIKARWQEKGWWEQPPGRSKRNAKAI
jgi:CRISPR-associated protein Cmr6